MTIKKKEIRIKNSRDIYETKNILIAAAALCFLCGFVGMFFVSPLKWWGGAVFGYAISVLCFRLLYHDICKATGYAPGKAKFASFSGYAVRYLIKGLALYASIQSDYLSFVSCVFGILSINAAIHILNFINMFLAKSEEKE